MQFSRITSSRPTYPSLIIRSTLVHNEFNTTVGVNHNNADIYTVYAMQYGYNNVSCNLMKNETSDINMHMHQASHPLSYRKKHNFILFLTLENINQLYSYSCINSLTKTNAKKKGENVNLFVHNF